MSENKSTGEIVKKQDQIRTSPIFSPTFNRAVKIHAVDDRLSSNGGALLLGELDSRLNFINSLSNLLHDPRHQEKIRYQISELLRERIFAMACGYSNQDDVDELAHDPLFRSAVWEIDGQKPLDERLASQPTQSRLLRDILAQKANLELLHNYVFEGIKTHRLLRSARKIKSATLDVDPLPIYVYGQQEGAAHNGYYRSKVYTPAACYFSPNGDLDSHQICHGFTGGILREGDCGKSEGLLELIKTEYKRAREIAEYVEVRIDSAGGYAEVINGMSEAQIPFTTRVPSNLAGVNDLAYPYLTRPVGRPPKEGCEFAVDLGDFKARPWESAHRLILVVVDKPDSQTGQLSLVPRYFFLLTTRQKKERSAFEVLDFYRGRGTFEDRYGELNGCINPHLSSKKFSENEAMFLLSLMAFNLLEILRSETERALEGGWDLRRFQKCVINTSARVVKRSRQIWIYLMRPFVLLFTTVVRCIEKLPRTITSPPKRRSLRPPPPHAFLSLHLRL